MRPIAAGEEKRTLLALKLSSKTTEELQQILLKRHPGNPRKYSWDKATRNAAMRVLRVRNALMPKDSGFYEEPHENGDGE